MKDLVFVFGSNFAGRHGKGAALTAKNEWGAQYGVGEGRTGNAYALPTKDENIQPRSLESIHESLNRFLDYAATEPYTYFMLTAVGTGLAGYTVEQVLSGIDINAVPMNVLFTPTWLKHLK